MVAATNTPTWRTRRWNVLPWVILAIGIPASALLYSIVKDSVEGIAQLRFERHASDTTHVIEARIHSYADILYGLAALFTSQNSVSRIQFHSYVESLNLGRRYPGFDVVNYAAYVPAKDKKQFENAVRHDTSLDPRGYPNFAIKPPGERPEYYVVTYIEPMQSFEFAFGLDLGANPAVAGANPKTLAALQHAARDSGELVASGRPIRIKAAKDYVGLAMRLAAYGGGVPLDTVRGRRAAYLGSVGAGFNVEKLMKGVIDEETARYMQFRVYDAGPVNAGPDPSSKTVEWLLFDSSQSFSTSTPRSIPDDLDAVFTRILPIEVGGRVWDVHFSARKNAAIDPVDRFLPSIVFGGGLLSSLLLFGMTYSLASSRDRAVAIANEITKDLRASTEQLTALSRRLVEVQESDRKQFSRELHDRIGQNLTALSINLDILKTQLASDGSAGLRSRLDDSAVLLESTTGTIENVMSELRPPMLDDYGLLPALQWYGNEFAGRTGIDVKVHGDERMERLTPATEIALFRITQEALNNVAKHAHAKCVDINLEHLSTQCMMSVSDDGMGFDAASIADSRRRPSLGMVTMRERTQAIGGQFEVGAVPGRGTQVVVRIPC